MEFFIPGLFIFLIAVLVSFFLVPKATPMTAAILAIVFLTYGVYDHYELFASEYKLSTWQESLKIYAPFIMIGVIIMYSMYGMIAFFTDGAVPVPSMPSIPSMSDGPSMPTMSNIPSLNQLSNQMTNTFSNVANSIGNTTSNIFSNNKGNNGSSFKNSITNFANNLGNSLGFNNNQNRLSRSAAEVI
jgi:predicted PurR-regulated permease PerM